MRHRSFFRAGLLAGITLLATAGCMNPALHDSARRGPFFTPTNFSGEPQLPAQLRRVLLLPLCGGDVAPAESVNALDAVFAAELQRQNRFEVVSLSREDCQRLFRVPELSSTAALPHNFLSTLRTRYAVDAVMFVDVTVFRAYRPLALGIRAKLATVEDVRLLWTFDTIFSADDKAVANSARHHFLASDRPDVPADLTPAALQSPSRFAGYAAYATFETLPLR